MFGLPKQVIIDVEKQTSQFVKILKNSLKPKKEEVLIISDHGVGDNILPGMLGYGYYIAAKKKGLNVNLLFQEPKKGFMHADPHVVKAIETLPKNNLIILALSNKLGRFGEHKSFRGFCKDRGHRFISATGLADVKASYFDRFLEAMSINTKRMQKKGSAIKKKWDKAKKIRITTPAGTDITFNVEGMIAIANLGCYHNPGEGGNMPAGEVYMPSKGYHNVNGKVVIDGSIKTAEGAILLTEQVTLTVEEGRVVKVEGEHSEKLISTFEKFEARAKYPDRIRFVSELAVGINPGAVLIGSMIMDEKVLGTGHIAIGSNAWFGGEIKTIYHGDQVFKNPTFYVDGEKMEI